VLARKTILEQYKNLKLYRK